MEISIANIIINYFLLHPNEKILKHKDLQEIIKQIQNHFKVDIIDNNVWGLEIIKNLCSDFLIIDEQCNIYQNNISDYMIQLQPIHEWLSFGIWKRSQEYYTLIENYNSNKKAT